MKTKKWAFLLITIVALVLSACGNNNANKNTASTDSSDSSDKKVITIGLNSRPTPLFDFYDEKENRVGYMQDYLTELQNKLPQYEFKFDTVENDALLVGVDTGKYALAAGDWFKNPAREEKYIFADNAYGYSVTGIIVKSDENSIESLEDLKGKEIVPMTATQGLRAVIEEFNKQNADNPITLGTVDVAVQAENLQKVNDGKYIAHVININQFEDIQKQLNLDLKLAGVISKEPVYFLFNPNQAELAADFNKATAELIEEGKLSELATKWFGVDFFQDLDAVKEGYKFKK